MNFIAYLIDLFASTIIISASQKYKARRDLEGPQKVLFKPALNAQNNFGILPKYKWCLIALIPIMSF